MKLLKAVNLYNSIIRLSDTPLDYASAHALIMTKAELEPHITFFANEEQKIVKECAVKGEDGNPIVTNGQITLIEDKAEDFHRKRRELGDIDVDVNRRKLKTIPKEITPATLETLLTAFDFPEEDDNG